MILIVGSNPSRLNTDPNVPFKGSKSEAILNQWLEKLQIGPYSVVNVSDIVCNGRSLRVSEWNLERLEGYCKKATKIIVLGRTAEKATKRVTDKAIQYMPHPSPLNRQLNSQEYVDNALQECYAYLWE